MAVQPLSTWHAEYYKMPPSASTIHLAITIPTLSSSHLLNTLGTHVVPTPCQTNDIRQIIEKADSDVALIDQDITRLNEVLAHAKLQRTEMYRHGQAHRALLAPVRRCPDEILSEIFIYWSHAENHQNSMPLRTGSICRRWREVALRTSALWSDIIVDTDRTRGIQDRDMLQELFRRTGVSRPISLEITGYCSPLSTFTENVLPIILPTSNRWINLRLPLSQDKIQSLSSIKGALFSLESLEIASERLDEGCDIFGVAPRLFHANVDLLGGNMTLPWTQLTDVSVGRDLTLERCLAILSDCPNLISCTFKRVIREMTESSRFRNGVIHHAHLHNLKLETYVNPSAFFNCLSTPKLCTLHIIYRFYYVGSDFYASAANFLLRSSCTIVIFKWDSFDLCPIGFAHITQFMAELEELYVTTNCTAALARELLLDLTLNADEKSNFCPRLHTITIQYVNEGIDKQVLLDFIKSRRPMQTSNQCVKPLRSVRLKREIKPEESDKVFLKELEVLRGDGIDIAIM